MGSEEDGEDLLPSEETRTKGKKEKESEKGRFKSKSGTTFASYEEFAHLLDEGLDEATEKSKKINKKVPYHMKSKRKRTK